MDRPCPMASKWVHMLLLNDFLFNPCLMMYCWTTLAGLIYFPYNYVCQNDIFHIVFFWWEYETMTCNILLRKMDLWEIWRFSIQEVWESNDSGYYNIWIEGLNELKVGLMIMHFQYGFSQNSPPPPPPGAIPNNVRLQSGGLHVGYIYASPCLYHWIAACSLKRKVAREPQENLILGRIITERCRKKLLEGPDRQFWQQLTPCLLVKLNFSLMESKLNFSLIDRFFYIRNISIKLDRFLHWILRIFSTYLQHMMRCVVVVKFFCYFQGPPTLETQLSENFHLQNRTPGDDSWHLLAECHRVYAPIGLLIFFSFWLFLVSMGASGLLLRFTLDTQPHTSSISSAPLIDVTQWQSFTHLILLFENLCVCACTSCVAFPGAYFIGLNSPVHIGCFSADSERALRGSTCSACLRLRTHVFLSGCHVKETLTVSFKVSHPRVSESLNVKFHPRSSSSQDQNSPNASRRALTRTAFVASNSSCHPVSLNSGLFFSVFSVFSHNLFLFRLTTKNKNTSLVCSRQRRRLLSQLSFIKDIKTFSGSVSHTHCFLFFCLSGLTLLFLVLVFVFNQ
ncbi:putative signal peptide protein [Puccinia sorghi]|uniref:Putative signal peptide protein n=1 Tax=Puccinia sorghi TaxID=27349 RepID=A0A0L6UFM1_9BASI|nr:putative signal peptide protein [Puccinia sorghi]